MMQNKLIFFSQYGNPLVFLMASALLTLFWPLIFSSKSYIHRIAILIQFIFQIYLIVTSVADIAEAGMSSYDLYIEYSVNYFLLSIKVSRIGLIFASLIIILWPAAYFYSISYLESSGEGSESRFLFFLNLSICSALLLSISGDLITLFICYEMLTLSTIPLIAHKYTEHVNQALKKYILYLVGASLCIWLPAILYINGSGWAIFNVGGNEVIADFSTKMQIILLALSIFGIAKAAIFPMHSWLPSAMAANYPTSAVLHAVVVVNAGIYCIYKVITEIFGIDLIACLLLENRGIQYILLFGIFYSGLMAIFQNTFKKVLAWSTVVQLNLITLIALSGSKIFFVISVWALIIHSFSKITLFFCGGYIYIRNYATKLDEFRGVAKGFKIIFTCFILAIIPMKFLTYKYILIECAKSLENKILLFAIIISSMISFIYFGKIFIEMSSRQLVYDDAQILRKPANPFMVLSIFYTTILALALMRHGQSVFRFLCEFLGGGL